jgi:hypothetical protein
MTIYDPWYQVYMSIQLVVFIRKSVYMCILAVSDVTDDITNWYTPPVYENH